jgi:hypothetical protein
VSVKNQGVGTREQVLNVLIACQCYGPDKPSHLLSTDAWLKPTASMVVLGEKLRRVSWATQSGWEVESGALFLRSSSIRPTLSVTRKRLPRTETARGKRTSGLRGLA